MTKKSKHKKTPLEFYDLEFLYNEYLPTVIDKIIKDNIVFPPTKNINVEGTSYVEYVNGEPHHLHLEEETNEILISNKDVRNCDFISIRSEICRKSLEIGYEHKRKIIKTIEDNSLSVEIKEGDDILEKYFDFLRQAKEMGPDMKYACNPNMARRLEKELNKPENLERIKEEMKKINS